MRTLNHQLIFKLPELLKITHKDFFARTGLTWCIWNSRMKKPREYKIHEIVRICNAFHIPVRKLFCDEPTTSHTELEDSLSVSSAEYSQVYFDTDKFRLSWKRDKSGNLDLNGKAQCLGVTRQVVHKWIKEGASSALTIGRLMQFCDLFQYDLFDFLVEEKSSRLPEPTLSSADKTTDKTHLINQLKRENTELKRSVWDLERQLKAARSLNSELMRSIDDLQYRIYKRPTHTEEDEPKELLMIASEDDIRPTDDPFEYKS